MVRVAVHRVGSKQHPLLQAEVQTLLLIPVIDVGARGVLCPLRVGLAQASGDHQGVVMVAR